MQHNAVYHKAKAVYLKRQFLIGSTCHQVKQVGPGAPSPFSAYMDENLYVFIYINYFKKLSKNHNL